MISPRRLGREEDGLTIIEVLVAAVVLVLGSFATFGIFRDATVDTQRAKATQVALGRAEQEMEVLRSLSYKELALTAAPPHSADEKSPNFRVSNGQFALNAEPRGNYAELVENGGSLYGGEFIEGGVVNPGPTPFTSGEVKGEIYRYVVWRNDASCPESTCPGTQSFKQVVVAVKLGTPGDQSGERGYVELQSDFIDPKNSSLNDPVPGSEGVITAQQFYLTDTPCSASGTTERQEITGNHALHNTLGTCASGLQTSSTVGAPDALLLGAPPDSAPENPNGPPVYDYSDNYPTQPTPETAKGIQLRRDETSGCHYVPTGSEPRWQVHRWVTDPMKSEYTLNGTVTLVFYTRALSDSLYTGEICAYLFDRHESGSPLVAKDTMFTNKVGGLPYWTYTPEGNGYWPRNNWEQVRLTMTFAGPKKIPVGDRLGVALSVERAATQGDAIGILYDHPNYRTRIEVDTTTPIEGG
jgi:type II secretory pathway pseudopilin PulG